MQLTATKSPTAAEERDRALAYVLVRLAIGASLFGVGALTRAAAIAGGLVMIVLVFGSTTIEQFGVIGDQLIHASLLAAVLTFRRHNTYSIDHLLAGDRQPRAVRPSASRK